MPSGGIRSGSPRELHVWETDLPHSGRLVHSMRCSCNRDPSELSGHAARTVALFAIRCFSEAGKPVHSA
jgi:hypothetical protein